MTSSHEKSSLHLRNRHRAPYDFKNLFIAHPELALYEKPNIYGETSIDFSNRDAMVLFNQVLLQKFYGIEYWNIPQDYLCPPVAGRADYIHFMADLLASGNQGIIPTGLGIKCLDSGVGASCIYPIIGTHEYGWHFTGSDSNEAALNNAAEIIDGNPAFTDKIELRFQSNPECIFQNIIQTGERFDLTVCNPPFYASLVEAESRALKKRNSFSQNKNTNESLSLSGKSNELFFDGGEKRFLANMIAESKAFHDSVLWFSSLVSKKSSLANAYTALEKAGASEVKTIPMAQGNKISRVIAWTFLNEAERREWTQHWKE